MTYQISADERILIPATRYALGRMTYVVRDTTSQIRDSWPTMSSQTRTQVAALVDEAIRSSESRGRTLGMDFDHADWVSLRNWMNEHERDEAAASPSRITMDEGMLVSAIRVETHGSDEAMRDLVIAETKHAWSDLSTNYRGVIARDIRSDIEMVDRVPEMFTHDMSPWIEMLGWIRTQTDPIDVRD